MREKKQSEKYVDKVRARAGVCFGFCGQDAKVVGLFFSPHPILLIVSPFRALRQVRLFHFLIALDLCFSRLAEAFRETLRCAAIQCTEVWGRTAISASVHQIFMPFRVWRR